MYDWRTTVFGINFMYIMLEKYPFVFSVVPPPHSASYVKVLVYYLFFFT